MLFYPSGSTNDDPMDSRRDMFPYQYQKWGICALKFSNSAGASGVERLPRHTFGQFQPLDPGNPQALGAYRLWFYEREKYARHTVNDNTPCYEGRC